MPTYLYECPVHGEFEHSHSINEKLEDCPACKDYQATLDCDAEIHKVKRLISGGTGFILSGSGWAKDSYS